jgi:ubiquinone/menaquinone biosynthesis C-methylase UbiE
VSKLDDQHYLLTRHYQDSTNLDARVQLHLRFSTNHYGWQRWVFDQLNLPREARVLEIGCGPGYLWRDNLARLPEAWQITLSDLSAGMLRQAQKNLAEARHRFRFENFDAQSIPLPTAHFDAVIANHMLYHVPDRARALSEIRRVLKPGGRLYAATNGRRHLRELHDLQQRFDPATNLGWDKIAHEVFALEDSAELAPWFVEITIRRYEDKLIITEAGPLVDYILSMSSAELIKTRRADLTRFIEHELAANGAIHISKDSGLIIAARS